MSSDGKLTADDTLDTRLASEAEWFEKIPDSLSAKLKVNSMENLIHSINGPVVTVADSKDFSCRKWSM